MLVLDIDIFLVMLTSHTDIALPAQIRVFIWPMQEILLNVIHVRLNLHTYSVYTA